MDSKLQNTMIRHWLQDNTDAIRLVESFIDISQTWDDLIDRDNPVTDDSINGMMICALIDIPRNPFYQQHYQNLQPIIEHCLFNWLDANTLEKNGSSRDLQVSYILRSVTTDLIIHIAYLVGGRDWRGMAAANIRRVIYRDNESFTDYRREIMAMRESGKRQNL